MHSHHRPSLVVGQRAAVADMRWPYTMAAASQHHNGPAAPLADQRAAIQPAAGHSVPVAVVRHSDGAAVAAADRHDTRPPADNDGRVRRALHGRPHTDADDAYATHRCQRAPADVHGKRQRPLQLLPQRLHKMAAVDHDDPAAYAPYADPNPVHDTCPH
ncbi:uncharacterized protein LOC116805617 isoform X2 [Drosophila grimshawi]|uniref:uncharacterized protein LOC116805617 isoform X2 n=1 Tax=Drosophila grimshawi TaxID=7222 RepID=UPI0013EF145A|nr:uncharacterized protein LOC116805617 isoform X2 [Drosophila grimshawi]